MEKKEHSMQAPLHLKGARTIAETFGVARETVVSWARLGAPVHMVGKKYQANYLELWTWIKNRSS